ncbi:hypothetical protein N656DRAFT_24362 [Canariomyces notabilis]|uniref:Uncharacterized protein n=1 Tax=Canariomyces notabilis TaxID=2074819 RepID=A0AAN6TMI8_9PEZI|nr:hypothetical protein N656DRAFT_24362 [Canariomyces arenarius]
MGDSKRTGDRKPAHTRPLDPALLDSWFQAQRKYIHRAKRRKGKIEKKKQREGEKEKLKRKKEQNEERERKRELVIDYRVVLD